MDTGWRKTFAHGLTGGARSKVSGGRFKDGFIGGFVGQSLEQHGVYEEMGITSTPRNYTERMYNAVASFVVGGTSARLTGGSFTNGGMSAAFGRMFNDIAASGRRKTLTLFGVKISHSTYDATLIETGESKKYTTWSFGVDSSLFELSSLGIQEYNTADSFQQFEGLTITISGGGSFGYANGSGGFILNKHYFGRDWEIGVGISASPVSFGSTLNYTKPTPLRDLSMPIMP